MFIAPNRFSRVLLLAFLPAYGIASVKLPIEVAGEPGTEVSVTVSVPSGFGKQVRSLRMQIHGLGYADMASVRINQGQWLTLNNETANIAEPGRSYGGIGGGFATLKLMLPLPEGGVVDQDNTIRFRFNRTNGIINGFRVLAINFLTADGRMVLTPDTFIEEDPNAWTPPLPDAESISAGRSLWQNAKLLANGLPSARTIQARCSDCHAQDGRDLKYFNYSNASIVARSRFHGLSELQGRQIASYIRSLPFPNPGRPWNPPYQPGPGLSAQPAANRAAGAGLSWALDNDADSLPFLFAGMSEKGAAAITAKVFSPDGSLNAREIPIALQLPDWNHWLPRVHPLDAWGEHFQHSEFSQLYEASHRAKPASADAILDFFRNWSKSRGKFLTPHLTLGSNQWSPDLSEKFYSAQLWQLVKTWEIIQDLGLEAAEPGLWPNVIPASTAPAEVNIPDGPFGMGGSGLTNEYFDNSWYQLQVLLNDGNHMRHDRRPVDWVYLIGHIRDLQRLGGQPEAARLLITVIKALQSSDPDIGPNNIAEGWRPDQNVDPRIIIDEEWAPLFQALRGDVKQALTESLLTAWLDKTMQYPPASYFARGAKARAYRIFPGMRNVSGGRVWEAVSQFQAAGVSAPLIKRLQDWGKAYNGMAALFNY